MHRQPSPMIARKELRKRSGVQQYTTFCLSKTPSVSPPTCSKPAACSLSAGVAGKCTPSVTAPRPWRSPQPPPSFYWPPCRRVVRALCSPNPTERNKPRLSLCTRNPPPFFCLNSCSLAAPLAGVFCTSKGLYTNSRSPAASKQRAGERRGGER